MRTSVASIVAAGVCVGTISGALSEVAFLAVAPSSRLRASPRSNRLPLSLAEEGLAASSAAPTAQSHVAPVAVVTAAVVVAALASRRRGQQQAARLAGGFLGAAGRALGVKSGRARQQVRRFFGGGGKDEEDEGPEVEDGVLSEKAQAACVKLQQEIDELKTHSEEKVAAHQRLTVEVNNFRSRTKQELNAARGKAAIPLIKELMPIADEFELAQNNLKVESDAEQGVKDKFDGLFGNMLENWKKLGVQKLESVGEEFNPEFHEAVSMIPSAEYKDGVVCNELRGGWVMKSSGSDAPQVLRPALVCVSSGPGP